MEEEKKQKIPLWTKLKLVLAVVMLFTELLAGYFSLVSSYTILTDSIIFFIYALFTYGYLNIFLSEIRDLRNVPWYLEEVESELLEP